MIKSISKSYGVPGIRLGILACADRTLQKKMNDLISIWNVNSYAEYFMQIFNLYAKSYCSACDKIGEQRKLLYEALKEISYLEPYPSQANYIMCRVTRKYTSKEFATMLLRRNNLLIKDLSGKADCGEGEFIRIAVKDERENRMLIDAMKALDV